jgi:Arc/MetJ-type ribon-helix-helix transcriptional regulator
MAGRDRMTIEEVVRQVLREEHSDVIRESVRAVTQELMEAEVVRHEALSDRAGWKTLPTGCRSGPGKLRAARTWNRG